MGWPSLLPTSVHQADVAKMLKVYQERDLPFGLRVEELQAIIGRSHEEALQLSQVFDNGSGTYVQGLWG